MSAISVKPALAALEAATKALNVVDANAAEVNAVRGTLDARRAELAEVEARLSRIKEETRKADGEHARWQHLQAQERVKGNSEVDRLQERLRTLDKQVEERRAEHDSIVAGINALSQRLRIG